MAAKPKPPAEIDPAKLQQAWEKALSIWGLAIQVDTPVIDPSSEAIAYIDLSTRRVVLNPARIGALDGLDCLEGLLAHELGHHLHYPHSLAVQARLELLERELLPIHGYSLLNLFSDFLINTDLARMQPHLAKQFAKLYRGMGGDAKAAKADPAFFFYLTAFEEAWSLPPRDLTGDAGVQLEKDFPGCRAQAQALAEELPNLAPNLFTQFIYFASIVSRYQLLDPEQGWTGASRSLNPTHGDHSSPAPGDYADALRRSAQESDAIKKAIDEGWLKPDAVPDKDASERIRAGALPGVLAGKPKELAEAMALHYRRLAERYLMKPPPQDAKGEPIVPSTLSDWEIGDSPKEIDWLASITAGGAQIGVARPLKRDWIEDDPAEGRIEWRARLEIYLDTSGSMPDPKASINAMTLAAQVLCMSAIRGGGQCRALIYSTNFVKHWEWTRSETTISKFLMSYIGGGTDFPFDQLQSSVKECGREQPIRVVLTDADFHYNLKARPESPEVLKKASETPFVALLNGATVNDAWVKYVAGLGAAVVPVQDLASFPQVAAALGEKLFGLDAPARRKA